MKSKKPTNQKMYNLFILSWPFLFHGKLCALHRAVTFTGSIMKLELCQRNLPKSISTEHPAPAILHRGSNLKRMEHKIVFILEKILANCQCIGSACQCHCSSQQTTIVSTYLSRKGWAGKHLRLNLMWQSRWLSTQDDQGTQGTKGKGGCQRSPSSRTMSLSNREIRGSHQ